jgi:hypothetical protein
MNPNEEETTMEDDDRQVEFDDETWEWAKKLSGLDDPTPYLIGIAIEAMEKDLKRRAETIPM